MESTRWPHPCALPDRNLGSPSNSRTRNASLTDPKAPAPRTKPGCRQLSDTRGRRSGRHRSAMSIGFRRCWRRGAWLALAPWLALGCMPARAAGDAGMCFAQLVAAIDIGHSRSNPGGKDVFGRDELDYNVELATTIKDQLVRSGIGRVVVINRDLDVASLPERPQRAFCAGADLFISVHHDNVNGSRLKTVAVDGRGRTACVR